MRIWIPLIWVALACSPKAPPEAPIVPAAPAEPAKPSVPLEKRLSQAAELLGEADGDEAKIRRAMEILRQAQPEAPGDATIHVNLGLAHHMLGDYESAERAYQSAIGLKPDLGDAYLYLGEVHRLQGRHESALANFRSGIRVAPDHRRLWVAEVAVLREMGRTQQAIDRAREGLKANAFNLELYNNLGLAYLDQGEPVLARFVFQKAQMTLEEAETDPHITGNIGWSYFLQNDVPRALLWLERARELDPELVSTRVLLAHIYMDDHNWEDALADLEVAAALDPSNPSIQLNLGICYRGVERHDEARRAYEQALVLAPTDTRPIFNLGILYGDSLKSYDASIQAFQDYVDRGGTEVALAEEYLRDVDREKTRVERRQQAEDERKKREQERLERQRILEAEAARAAERQAIEAAATPEEEPVVDDAEADPSEEEGGTPDAAEPTVEEGAPSPDGGSAPDDEGVWE